MTKTIKFAVSMPAEEFKDLEARRRKAKATRSLFVREAVRKSVREPGLPGNGMAPGVREESRIYGAESPPDLTDMEERRRRAIAAAGQFGSGLADLASGHDRYFTEDITDSGVHQLKGSCSKTGRSGGSRKNANRNERPPQKRAGEEDGGGAG